MEVKKPVDEQLYEINLDVYGFTGGPKLGRFRLLNKVYLFIFCFHIEISNTE